MEQFGGKDRDKALREFDEAKRRMIDTRALYMSRLEINPDATRDEVVYLIKHPVELDDILREAIEAAAGELVATYYVVATEPFRILVLFQVYDWTAEALNPVEEALHMGRNFCVTETVHLIDRGRWERGVRRPVPSEILHGEPDSGE